MNALSRLTFLLAVFVAALAALSAKASADDKPKDYWRAWAVTEGDKTKLVVEGIYNDGGPGLVVSLQDADPQGINPKILLLDLKTSKLPGVWPTVVHAVPAYYSKAPYKYGKYDSVQIRYPDGNLTTIDKITDAGKGPK